MIDSECSPIRSSANWAIDEFGKGHVFSPGKSKEFFLNKVGGIAWSLLDGKKTVNSIAEKIQNMYPLVDGEVIQQDVIDLLKNLEAEKLISPWFKSLRNALDECRSNPVPSLQQATDILLCTSPSTSFGLYYGNNGNESVLPDTAPLGIGYITAFLRQNGFRVQMLDLVHQDFEKLSGVFYNALMQLQPSIVGFTVFTETLNGALELARFAKALIKGVSIVFGGPHPTFCDREILESHHEVDFVVRYDGEQTMLELVTSILKGGKDLSEINGLTYRTSGGDINQNPPRPFFEDLDELPFPERIPFINLHNHEAVIKMASVITSRGCPFECVYCAAAAKSGRRYRVRNPENVYEEVKTLRESGSQVIHFVDDTITIYPKRAYKLFELLKSLNIMWTCESRVDVISREGSKMIQEMKESGCVAIQFGVESGNNSILKAIKKGITIDEIKMAFQLAHDAGILATGSMIIGHFCDTKETIQESIDFAEFLQKTLGAGVVMGVTVPYPGTLVWNKAQEMGVEILSFDFDGYVVTNPIINTLYLTASQLRYFQYGAMTRLLRSLPKEWAEFKGKLRGFMSEERA